MLRDLREAIMSDLGGKDQLSQAQMILVDDVARLTFWIDSIDGWLLTLPSVINSARSSRSSKSARHRSIFQTFRGVTGA
jgi:bacteriorhodopsin